MNYDWRFDIVWDYREVYFSGAVMTMSISLIAVTMALTIGILLGSLRANRTRFFSPAAAVYIEFVRNTPLLVQIFWFFYCMPVLFGVSFSAFWSATITLGIHFSAYVAEVFRSGISSIDRGQGDAARVMGLSRLQTMRHIILPQAFKRVIPPLVNCFADIVKLSSLAAVIGVYEMLHSINNLIMNSFRPLELYTALAVFYFLLIYPISLTAQLVERRMARSNA
ncbi:polar amino acid transport system permease protein [Natronocella acetinitrilica]|uniref:Polar amino acid transport system permease protein n=1 Tax=Natronocella acetinitrilica TaxID=414046 RepID=A0AAE3KD24_9GAMM|nr:amino acid ABC transporter permease [Natronocella acetinitrilica]MCP1675753.1 polar amino acid transport system permease protein [Natronocella acetinitrilica]